MATREEVKKLAALARLSIPEEKLTAFAAELDAILSYVSQLETLDVSAGLDNERPLLRNIMREDDAPHESGMYTEKLVAQFPERAGDALSVKQIVSHD